MEQKKALGSNQAEEQLIMHRKAAPQEQRPCGHDLLILCRGRAVPNN